MINKKLYVKLYILMEASPMNLKRLADAFLGNSITNRGIRIQQSLKMTYVGFSRPTNLLCVAIHKDRFDRYLSEINKDIWEIKEIN